MGGIIPCISEVREPGFRVAETWQRVSAHAIVPTLRNWSSLPRTRITDPTSRLG